MQMKVLGISGSPKKDGNTHLFLTRALESLDDPDTQIQIIDLAGKNIADCVHCNWCLKNNDDSRICVQKDDAEEILRAIRNADVLVLASPAYYGRMTARMAALLDRTRPLLFSKPHRGSMTDKPGVALTVTWGRNSGGETTLLSMINAFLVLEMLPVSHHASGALFGAVGISNPLIVGAEKENRLSVEHDALGILTAQNVIKRAVDLSGRITRRI